MFSTNAQVCPVFLFFSTNDDDDISLDPSEIEIDQDVSLLEKASMVLQLVILQDAHAAGKRIRQITGSSALNSILSESK